MHSIRYQFPSFLHDTVTLSLSLSTKMTSDRQLTNPATRSPLIASSPFAQTPFFIQQFFKPNPKLLAMNPVEVLQNFHKAITSTADQCIQFLHFSATQNPFLNKVLSFSSDFHNLQVQCRSRRRMNSLSNHNFAAVLPGDSVAGIVAANGILNFLNLYNTVLVVRLVLTWFPQAPPQIVSPLSTLCDPYLNIFRGIIPPLGGLDLSPILAFLVLNAFTSAATALPAELPSTGVAHQGSSLPRITDLTASQKKWRRRLEGNSSVNSNGTK